LANNATEINVRAVDKTLIAIVAGCCRVEEERELPLFEVLVAVADELEVAELVAVADELEVAEEVGVEEADGAGAVNISAEYFESPPAV
jgi:hypothetical protein